MRGPGRLALAALLLAALAGCSQPQQADTPEPVHLATQAGVDSGQVTAAQPTFSHAIKLENRSYGRLAVTLILKSNLPEDQLVLNVTGPSTKGQEASTSPFLYVYPGANPTLAFDAPAPGEWTARVTLASGATADYQIDWCADSDAAHGPDGNLACHRY